MRCLHWRILLAGHGAFLSATPLSFRRDHATRPAVGWVTNCCSGFMVV